MRNERTRDPGPYVPLSERWKTPPVFDVIPPDATPEEVMRLRFGYLPPAVGTIARVLWDRLGLAGQDGGER